jgi:cytochrome c-type biogenesis protein CcmF
MFSNRRKGKVGMLFGDLALKTSAMLAVLAFIGAVRWARGNARSERTFRWAYHGMTAGLVIASAQLMAAILNHDFRLTYVVGYTSRDLPLLYLISAFWAGQQGTYLLWALVGALIGYALMVRQSWEPAAVMACYVPTVGFLLGLMLDPGGNPFRLASQVPLDGRGLNPLLQDPWMASHPPLVFLGYAAATVPAVLALVALLKRREDTWLQPALRWSIAAFVLLGAGIVLGGFWAYKVLGWGGYWGWDPVENASLVPWLVVIALLHGVLVQKATGALPRTNLALALAGYVLVFYATFLTRSGVLADFSVHSFPAGSIFRLLLGIQLLILVVSAMALLRRGSIPAPGVPVRLAWPFVLSWVIVLLVISAGMVLIGTSWPILTSWLGKPASFGPSWYNTVSLPIYLLLCGVLAVAPFLAWAPRPGAIALRRVLVVAAVALAGTIVAAALGARGAGNLLLFFAGLGALAANTIRLIEVGRVRMLQAGAAVAHIGFALMILGIVGSSAWGTNQKARLPLGQPVDVLGRTLVFQGHVEGSEPQDRYRVRVIEGDESVAADVGMYTVSTGTEEQTMHKPAILRRLRGDLYIAPAGLDVEGGGPQEVSLSKGRPTRLGDATLTFERFETRDLDGQGMIVWAHVNLAVGAETESLALPYRLSGGQAESIPVQPTSPTGIRTLRLTRMAVDEGLVLVQADLGDANATHVLYLEVSTKPLIGLLWGGTLLLGAGCLLALTRCWVEARARGAAAARPAFPGPPLRAPKQDRRTPLPVGRILHPGD